MSLNLMMELILCSFGCCLNLLMKSSTFASTSPSPSSSLNLSTMSSSLQSRPHLEPLASSLASKLQNPPSRLEEIKTTSKAGIGKGSATGSAGIPEVLVAWSSQGQGRAVERGLEGRGVGVAVAVVGSRSRGRAGVEVTQVRSSSSECCRVERRKDSGGGFI
ncbi:hypothetical protein CRG98_035540 [Punica granatum]|uniref:Uncharacterized protein n=1 Tax=Punica granatum TaxID=22663 RepID=A0A2I0IJ91_PUNGR|nr:hypothetical protein CRG98_035540 [Punica granatum]